MIPGFAGFFFRKKTNIVIYLLDRIAGFKVFFQKENEYCNLSFRQDCRI
jgi:hypothetical protein